MQKQIHLCLLLNLINPYQESSKEQLYRQFPDLILWALSQQKLTQ